MRCCCWCCSQHVSEHINVWQCMFAHRHIYTHAHRTCRACLASTMGSRGESRRRLSACLMLLSTGGSLPDGSLLGPTLSARDCITVLHDGQAILVGSAALQHSTLPPPQSLASCLQTSADGRVQQTHILGYRPEGSPRQTQHAFFTVLQPKRRYTCRWPNKCHACCTAVAGQTAWRCLLRNAPHSCNTARHLACPQLHPGAGGSAQGLPGHACSPPQVYSFAHRLSLPEWACIIISEGRNRQPAAYYISSKGQLHKDCHGQLDGALAGQTGGWRKKIPVHVAPPTGLQQRLWQLTSDSVRTVQPSASTERQALSRVHVPTCEPPGGGAVQSRAPGTPGCAVAVPACPPRPATAAAP